MSGYQRNGYNSDQISVGSQDEQHYEVEHLATFAVSPQAGLVYPSDGMRRLLQMEKTSGIWTQKLYLRLEANWVVIIDYENGEIVEKFPIHLIRDPTAFTSSDPKEIYDNIFVFIVGEDPVTQNPPEMHIFQCVRVKATALVEEMKGFMTGVKKGAIPPPPNAPPPEPPNPARDLPPFGQAVDHRADDASSTSSEKYERDVAVLNRCFDDIERFIARLQHAAAASRELDRRRRSRKSKKKDHGDGIMAVRARAPPEKDFVDTLQKFKLSFNLLAKLKAHIHDPNAPELVHFLFTPLALIIDASRDAQLEPNLPARVISPLLTTEAVELLTNCLTSKETELWHSLGEAWQIPREKWKGYVTPYHPVFADGWAPDYPVVEEKERANERYFYEAERAASSPVRRERSETPPSEAYRQSNRAGSDVSGDSVERSGVEDVSERRQRLWIEELRKRDARIVQVTYPRTANNDKELTVVRGELLEVIDDSKNWWKCRNLRGQVAHVPHTIVTPYLFEDESFQPYHHQETRPGPSADWAKRQGRKENVFDDSFSEDEDGLPSRSSRPSQRPPPPKPVTQKKQNPLPPPPPVNRRDQLSDSESSVSEEEPPKRNQRRSSNSSQENLLEELKTAVQRSSPVSLKIKKTPDAYLDHRSAPNEVQKFLTAKKFGDDVKRKFRGKNGQDLFDMKKSEYVKLLGKEEGHRLESYVTIQKNITQYKTLRTSELKLALQRARIRSGVSRSPSPEKVVKSTFLPPPKKLFEYNESGSVSSPHSSPRAGRKQRELSESPPPERKSTKLPPPPPVTRNSRQEDSSRRNKSGERNGWRDSSESPPPSRKVSKKRWDAPPTVPPARRDDSPRSKSREKNSRRDPSPSPPPPPPISKHRDASPQKRSSKKEMSNGWKDPSPSPPPARKPSSRETSKAKNTSKTQPAAQKNKVTNGDHARKKEEKRIPIAYQDSDSDAEPPAPGTLREQILKQRKRLSSVK